ncbi:MULTISPECIES: ribose 5-phosphate isomerase B [unclassified Imperialibacter]|uniref:ribose 5-phosphate isomerase B n=1 Tax=unclassified Imperialibacter TaxID=2629706 RepID=UPI001258BD32|nr:MULTISPECIES: ribose 5-phosphate isomerase B [unclassified Imperialibacter]CAD5270099.1 Ribose-5-phosphate isomerase B [Imperialibacter sp. 89]CAD5297998.1 Ribose-5-phosphate isomerase B [Imperialibacter sp. 75]VVT34261.1 Ribose-5-phosphate isomerase B [Imperialibacter sp. EC-SDR9]
MSLKIALGADHAGFGYKEKILAFLQREGHVVKDFGTYSADSIDYADFAHPVATSVESHESDFGILICGSGNGVAMTANKHQQIRAALCWKEELASLARQHNNANVLCMPERFVDYEEAEKMVKAFLSVEFEGGRHERRVGKISC